MTSQEIGYFLDSKHAEIIKTAKAILNKNFAERYFNWKELEYLCAQLARQEGYEITFLDFDNEAKPDGGIDIIAESQEQTLLIQSKKSEYEKDNQDYDKDNISVSTVRSFYGVISDKQKRDPDGEYLGWFITIRNFTKPARDQFEDSDDMELIDYSRLCSLIKDTELLEWEPTWHGLDDLRNRKNILQNELKALNIAKNKLEEENKYKQNIIKSDEYGKLESSKGLYKFTTVCLILGLLGFWFYTNIQSQSSLTKEAKLNFDNFLLKSSKDNDVANSKDIESRLTKLQMENKNLVSQLSNLRDNQSKIVESSAQVEDLKTQITKLTTENTGLGAKLNPNNEVQGFTWVGVDSGKLKAFRFEKNSIVSIDTTFLTFTSKFEALR